MAIAALVIAAVGVVIGGAGLGFNLQTRSRLRRENIDRVGWGVNWRFVPDGLEVGNYYAPVITDVCVYVAGECLAPVNYRLKAGDPSVWSVPDGCTRAYDSVTITFIENGDSWTVSSEARTRRPH